MPNTAASSTFRIILGISAALGAALMTMLDVGLASQGGDSVVGAVLTGIVFGALAGAVLGVIPAALLAQADKGSSQVEVDSEPAVIGEASAKVQEAAPGGSVTTASTHVAEREFVATPAARPPLKLSLVMAISALPLFVFELFLHLIKFGIKVGDIGWRAPIWFVFFAAGWLMRGRGTPLHQLAFSGASVGVLDVWISFLIRGSGGAHAFDGTTPGRVLIVTMIVTPVWAAFLAVAGGAVYGEFGGGEKPSRDKRTGRAGS